MIKQLGGKKLTIETNKVLKKSVFKHLSNNFKNIETKTTGPFSSASDASLDTNFDVFRKTFMGF